MKNISTNIEAIKKDLQKIVKKFRDAKPDTKNWRGQTCRDEFPKAMMTCQQMINGTATVNFGHNNDRHNAELAAFTESEAFKAFCEKYDIRVGVKEVNQDDRVQIRIHY